MNDQHGLTIVPAASVSLQDTTLTTNKTILFACLSTAGITQVVVVFDGAGDDGQIETITPYVGNTSTALPSGTLKQLLRMYSGAEPRETELNLSDAITELAFDFLREVESGWENNDGGYGEFTFDVESGTISLDFNARVTESIYSSYTL